MEKIYRALVFIKNNHHIYHKRIGILLLLISTLATSLFLLNITRKRVDSATVTFINSWGIQGAGHGQFETPSGIAFDSLGNIYIADSNNNRIQKFDSNGVYLTQIGDYGTGNGQLNYPTDVAIDSDNNIYVVDSSNARIEKFDSSGNFVKTWGVYGSGDGNFSGPTGITIDSSQNVYVVDRENNRIQIFDKNGKYLSQFGSHGTGDGQFNRPYDAVVDPWGNIFVTDSNNDRVEKFKTDGTYISKFSISQTPMGIAVDSNGILYVADYQNSRIFRVDPNRNSQSNWGSNGTGDGQFIEPTGVAVSSNGHIFVADTGNHRIQEFSVTADLGQYGSFADTNAYKGAAVTHSFVKVGNKVYVGGGNGLEVIEASTGAKIPWNFNSPTNPLTATYSGVWALAYSANTQTLYAGTEYGLDAYDLSGGTGTYFWSANILYGEGWPPQVEALEIIGNTLYAGGFFDTIDSQPRQNFAAFDITNPTPTLTSFIANVGGYGYIQALKQGGGNLYVGGYFDSLGGINQHDLAMIDLSGAATVSAAFAPQFNQAEGATIHSIAYYNGQVYAGGFFTTIGSTNLNNLGRVDALTGIEDSTWTHPATNQVYALSIKDSYLYVGESQQAGSGVKDGSNGGSTYSINLATDVLTDWNPSSTQGINALLPTDEVLYVGLVGPATPEGKSSNSVDFVKNILAPKKAFADIGGLAGYIYIALFRPFTPSPTVTPMPTITPTPGPTATPSATATPGPTATLTPTSAASGTVATGSSLLTSNSNGSTSLPNTGPENVAKIGIIGGILLLIGGLILVF